MSLKITTAQVVKTSVSVNNSPNPEYTHPHPPPPPPRDNHILPTYDMTRGFKPYTIKNIVYLWGTE